MLPAACEPSEPAVSCFLSTTVSQCAKRQVTPQRSQNSQSSACQIVSSNSPTCVDQRAPKQSAAGGRDGRPPEICLGRNRRLARRPRQPMEAGLLAASEQDVAVGDAGAGRFRAVPASDFQGVREQFVVLIEKKKPVASGGSNSRVAVGGKTAVVLATDALDASAVARSDVGSRIGAAVVGDDDFLRHAGLTQNALDGARESVAAPLYAGMMTLVVNLGV